MEPEDQDIALIDRYLDGTLNADERAVVEQRIQDDPEFAADVDAVRDVVVGLKEHGRKAMKAELAAIGASITANGGFDDYTPSQNPSPPSTPKKGGSLGGKLFSVLFFGLVGTGIYLWYTDQVPEVIMQFFEEEQVDEVPSERSYNEGPVEEVEPEQVKRIEEETQEVKITYDTIYLREGETVELPASAEVDTIYSTVTQPAVEEVIEQGNF